MVQFIEKIKTIILNFFLEKYYFIEDIEIFCSNFDEEYYDEECINVFLEALKKKEKKIGNSFKLETLKFPPEI